jgi:ribonuclease inhibitor
MKSMGKDAEFVWLRDKLAWVGAGFIHRLPADRESALADLRRLGFEVKLLDGTKIASAAEFHEEAATTFGFPDYYGRNWDAFNDSFGDLDLPLHTAVVWIEARRLVEVDLKTFAEAICLLNDQQHAYSTVGTQIDSDRTLHRLKPRSLHDALGGHS